MSEIATTLGTKYRPVFALIVLVAIAISVTMGVWSIPMIKRDAAELAPFDSRYGGYSWSDARAFLFALSPSGARFYLNVQQRLDTPFPALLAVAMGWSILLPAPSTLGGWRLLLAIPVVPQAVFDYLENNGVATMIRRGPDAITPELVAASSAFTQLKFFFVAVSAVLIVTLSVSRGVRAARTFMRKSGV